MTQLLTFHEDLVLAGGLRATVVQFGQHHFFVVLGALGTPRGECETIGPFASKLEASRRARTLQQRGYAGAEAL